VQDKIKRKRNEGDS